jgi:hypothetical protein
MEPSLKSAGMPGAPSCSEGQQAMIPTTVVVDLFSGVADHLASAHDLIHESIAEPDGAALSGAAALVRNAGAAVDRAMRALGGLAWNTPEGWLLTPVAAQALARLESSQDDRERLRLDPGHFDAMDPRTVEWAVKFDSLPAEVRARWAQLVNEGQAEGEQA